MSLTTILQNAREARSAARTYAREIFQSRCSENLEGTRQWAAYIEASDEWCRAVMAADIAYLDAVDSTFKAEDARLAGIAIRARAGA